MFLRISGSWYVDLESFLLLKFYEIQRRLKAQFWPAQKCWSILQSALTIFTMGDPWLCWRLHAVTFSLIFPLIIDKKIDISKLQSFFYLFSKLDFSGVQTKPIISNYDEWKKFLNQSSLTQKKDKTIPSKAMNIYFFSCI